MTLPRRPILDLVKDVLAAEHHLVARAQDDLHVQLAQLRGAAFQGTVIYDDNRPPIGILDVKARPGEMVELELATFEPHSGIYRGHRFLAGETVHPPLEDSPQSLILLGVGLRESGHDVSGDDRQVLQDVASAVKILFGD